MSSPQRWLETGLPRVRSQARRLKPSYRRRVRALEGLSRQEVFEQYYRRRHWGDGESASGWGSTMSATSDLRTSLPRLLSDLGVQTLLDVPCGDHHWMAAVDLGDIDYIGGDIVPDLVAEVATRWPGPRKRFEVIDLADDPLPPSDAVFTRDCLLHLDLATIQAVLRNVARSDTRWLLASDYPDLRTNVDSPIGPAMPVSLRVAPFSLPPPVRTVDDHGPDSRRKTIAVWSIESVRAATRTEAT